MTVMLVFQLDTIPGINAHLTSVTNTSSSRHTGVKEPDLTPPSGKNGLGSVAPRTQHSMAVSGSQSTPFPRASRGILSFWRMSRL